MWNESWTHAGWATQVLSQEDARRSPRYDQYLSAFFELPTVNRVEYEVACYMRWVAMSMVAGEGAVMADYDVLNLGWPAQEVPARLTVLQGSVPSVVIGTAAEFERIADFFANFKLPPSDEERTAQHLLKEDGQVHLSDMVLVQLAVHTLPGLWKMNFTGTGLSSGDGSRAEGDHVQRAVSRLALVDEDSSRRALLAEGKSRSQLIRESLLENAQSRLAPLPPQPSAVGGAFPPPLPRKFTMPLSMLQRTAHALWRSPRLVQLAGRLVAPGGNLTVAVLGGSFSARMRGNWVEQVGVALADWFPDKSLQLVNAAKGGSTPVYALACTEFLVPAEADIIVVEYNPNIRFSCYALKPEEARECVEFEILLRKLQSWPGRPLILLLQMGYPMPESRQNTPASAFQASAEEGMAVLCAYYGLPYISMRDGVWQSQRAGMPGFADSDTRNLEGPIGRQSLFHYKQAGHTLAADALLYWLREGLALGGAASDDDGAARAGDALWAEQELPPPLWLPAAEVPTTLICGHSTFNESGSEQLAVSAAAGWAIAADDPAGRKFGYVQYGRNASSLLRFSWRAERAGGATVVLLGYLRSYDASMGAFAVTCADDCSCPPLTVNSLHKAKTSVTDFVRLPLTIASSGTCTLQVAPDPQNADAAKVKILALVVMACAAERCESLDYISPSRVDF